MQRKLPIAALFLCVPLFATNLNTSVYYFRQSHLDNCEADLQAAKSLGNKKVNLVFTFHFRGDIKKHRIESLCFQSDNGCEEIKNAVLDNMQKGLKSCFKKAFDMGMNAAFLPHIDFGGEEKYWRNQLVFAPKEKFNGVSYYEALIEPLSKSLLDLLSQPEYSERTVDFSIAGEMGSSAFHYPEEYLDIIEEFQKLFHGKKVEVGISLNHNLVGGEDYFYSEEKLKNVERLLNQSAFVGISAYTPLNPATLDRGEIYKNVSRFEAELEAYGIHMMKNQKIHFSEIAMGGGTLAEDGNAAKTPFDAARAPWVGVRAPYTLENDPWQVPELRELRKNYYQSILSLLEKPLPDEREISAAYMWNLGSWDPQGMWVAQYKDAEIIEMIKAHNSP